MSVLMTLSRKSDNYYKFNALLNHALKPLTIPTQTIGESTMMKIYIEI